MPKLTVVDDPAQPAAEPAKKAAAAKQPARAKASTGGRLLASAEKLPNEKEKVNSLHYGDLGTGKTSDVAAMANHGRTIVINAEGGLKRRPLEKLGIDVDNIEVLPKDPNDISEDFFKGLHAEIKTELEQSPDSIFGVVWDSITDIHVRMVRNVVDYQLGRAAAKSVSRVKEAAAGDMINEHFIDLSDYGIMTSQLRQILRWYRDLPCHFAVTALERRDKDDDGKVVYRPAVTPALAKDLTTFQDIVCYTSVADLGDGGPEEYRGLFRPVGKHRGRDRFGACPKYLIDPTFDRILSYVYDEVDIDTDPVMLEAKERHRALGLIKGEQAINAAEAETSDEPTDEAEADAEA